MEKGIIYFSAPWCGPCKVMSPMMEQLAAKGLPIQKVNIDYDASTVAKYNVKSVPTCVLVDRSHNELKRHSGAMNETQLKAWYEG